jgi:hypothetical protein
MVSCALAELIVYVEGGRGGCTCCVAICGINGMFNEAVLEEKKLPEHWAGASAGRGATAPTRMRGGAKLMRELQNLLPRADHTEANA